MRNVIAAIATLTLFAVILLLPSHPYANDQSDPRYWSTVAAPVTCETPYDSESSVEYFKCLP